MTTKTMPTRKKVKPVPDGYHTVTPHLVLYVEDADKAFDRAVKAGCTARQSPTDMFWGDRWGQVIDPFGHTWGLATHIEDVPPSEMGKRHQEFMAKMQQGAGKKS